MDWVVRTGDWMKEDYWLNLTQLADKKLVSRIFNQDMSLKKIDRKFAFKLLDEMIKWDKRIIRSGIVTDEDALNALLTIQDYFFYMIMKADLKDIDTHLEPLLGDILRRVHSKHRNPYYEGFFTSLVQMLLFQKMYYSFGEKEWILDWTMRLQKGLDKLRISYK